jgi:hypothetical protein
MDSIVNELFRRAQEQSENARPSASQESIDALRRLAFDAKEAATPCPVCMEEFKEGDTILGMSCGHAYHESCLVPWLNKTDTCPVCRQVV